MLVNVKLVIKACIQIFDLLKTEHCGSFWPCFPVNIAKAMYESIQGSVLDVKLTMFNKYDRLQKWPQIIHLLVSTWPFLLILSAHSDWALPCDLFWPME